MPEIIHYPSWWNQNFLIFVFIFPWGICDISYRLKLQRHMSWPVWSSTRVPIFQSSIVCGERIIYHNQHRADHKSYFSVWVYREREREWETRDIAQGSWHHGPAGSNCLGWHTWYRSVAYAVARNGSWGYTPLVKKYTTDLIIEAMNQYSCISCTNAIMYTL